MHVPDTERVCRILAIGETPGDGHTRVARGGFFDVVAGGEASHQAMLDLCLRIQRALEARGRKLEDLTREDFTRLLGEIAP